MPTLTVSDEDAGTRIDTFLARHVAGWSRRKANEAIAAGRVRLNGRRARKSQPIAAGDNVAFAEMRPALQPNPDLNLSVLYADESLFAVDKPAGIPSVAIRADETGTVANFLMSLDDRLATVTNPLEAGLVHRLDTSTSGVVLAARTASSYDDLRQQFRDHTVVKEYLAIVEGDLEVGGKRRTWLAHTGKKGSKVREQPSGSAAQLAITVYRPVERFGTETLLAIQIETGVMHQIRVHMSALGHPVVGDTLYDSRINAPRPFLHAARLEFTHPVKEERVEVSSPLAPDFEAHLAQLQKKKRRPERNSSKSRA
ncbi:MAG: RluA family pseudouridine synthase [Deltaproteobacteria bacterium]|nr:RluA family pseudouridine synthase [Deltaproteobacteria bacterium]